MSNNPQEQTPQANREYNKEGMHRNIEITQAVINVGGTELRVWHILQQDIFAHMLSRFNKEHPNNNTPSNAKQKIIKYVNKQFGLRVAFKSKDAFMKHLAEQTRKMAQQMKS